jgi:hypothetical protein
MADETAGPERDRPPVGSVGSVAEETARLLDALLAGTSGTSGPGEASGRAYATAEAPVSEPAADPCPTCGHVPGAQHTTAQDGEVCHLCPVCQLLRVVRTVRPETLDRLADLAAAVTDTLRDVAASRWRDTGTPPPRRARPEVEDIQIEGDESEVETGEAR